MNLKPLAVAICGFLVLFTTACDRLSVDIRRRDEDPALWRNVLAAEVRMTETGPAAAEKLSQLLDRVAALPGVEQVAAVNVLPGAGLWHQVKIALEGSPPHERPAGFLQVVSPGYFRMMELNLILGRSFSATDSESSPPVAIVNESYARQMSYREGKALRGDFLGKRVRLGGDSGPWLTIVGIVQDGPRVQNVMEVYVPYTQHAVYGPWVGSRPVRAGEPSWYVLVRFAGDLRTATPGLQQASGLEFRTLEERLTVYTNKYESNSR